MIRKLPDPKMDWIKVIAELERRSSRALDDAMQATVTNDELTVRQCLLMSDMALMWANALKAGLSHD